jgi:hypothetical protein
MEKIDEVQQKAHAQNVSNTFEGCVGKSKGIKQVLW